MQVEERVRQIMLNVVDVSESELVPDAKLRSDLGATSVEVVEIVAGLENEFDLEISDEEVTQIRTYGEIVDYVQAKLNEKA